MSALPLASSDASASSPPPRFRRSDTAIPALHALHREVWRADQLDAPRIHALPSGYPILDAELPGGGWPSGVLTELLLDDDGLGELRLLAPTLRVLGAYERHVVLLGPPHLPYGPALAALGLKLDRMIVIRAERPADRLWAVEQALKAGNVGALLAWLPQAKPEQLRRLQLAAQHSDGPCLLFRPESAQHMSSPAPLRLLCRSARVPRGGLDERKLMVQVLKRRGPVLAAPIAIDLPQPVAPRATRLPSPVRLHVVDRACAAQAGA